MKGICNRFDRARRGAVVLKRALTRALNFSAKVATISAMRESDRALLSTLDPNEDSRGGGAHGNEAHSRATG